MSTETYKRKRHAREPIVAPSDAYTFCKKETYTRPTKEPQRCGAHRGAQRFAYLLKQKTKETYTRPTKEPYAYTFWGKERHTRPTKEPQLCGAKPRHTRTMHTPIFNLFVGLSL